MTLEESRALYRRLRSEYNGDESVVVLSVVHDGDDTEQFTNMDAGPVTGGIVLARLIQLYAVKNNMSVEQAIKTVSALANNLSSPWERKA